MTSDTAFLTTRVSVTVKDDTLLVSLWTPEAHNNWVRVLSKRGKYAVGIDIEVEVDRSFGV
jgi:hypothetical protein